MTKEEAKEAIRDAFGNSEYTEELIEALEQESCDDIVNRKLEELFKRVGNIEKQIKEDKEVQLKKLKAELDYAKFRCVLENISEEV